MRVIVLGAGHIGSAIVRLLVSDGHYDVTVVDSDASALNRVGGRTLTAKVTRETCSRFIAGHEAILNALPYEWSVPVAEAAIDAGVHYLDLTEDVIASESIKGLSERARALVIPHCGLAPGFVAIAANHMATKFEKVDQIKLRVGAIPQFPTNSLAYDFTWSIDGLVNEYVKPCEILEDGIRRWIPALSDLESLRIEGNEYEAFSTSGGLGTLCDTWAGEIGRLDYKTIRYPGHCKLMRFLLIDLKLAEDIELLKRILKRAIPFTNQDQVLIYVSALGIRNQTVTKEHLVYRLTAGSVAGGWMTAIQLATASSACAILDMVKNRVLPQGGFVRQEQIPFQDFIDSPFGRVFSQGVMGA